MDWASVAGLALALAGILTGQVLEGGHAGSLVQPAALAIVVVGTCGAVLLQSNMPVFVRGVKMARLVFSLQQENHAAMSEEILAWSTMSRREGLLSLERFIPSVQDPFVAMALRLAVDGIDPLKMREILDIEIGAYERHERQAARIWESAGGYAPTIGILGAVLGLIHVMENLTEPSKVGSGIAVAFVATIYGVGLANLVFLPIANKLKAIIAHEVARRDMLVDVFAGLVQGDNARLIQERLTAWR
ncbi:MAG TPA: flagellar motor protein [Noviherbaspirillum sp.]